MRLIGVGLIKEAPPINGRHFCYVDCHGEVESGETKMGMVMKMDWRVLGWNWPGLCGIGPDWDWAGLGWTGFERAGLSWLDCAGLSWTGLEWAGLSWSGLDWAGLS